MRQTSRLIDLLPSAAMVAIGAVLILLAIAGCAEIREGRQAAGYTPMDEMRAACATAARAYAVAIERTRAGEMSAATFAAVDDGYAGVVETCRAVLLDGEPATAGDAARVASWTASAEAMPPGTSPGARL